MLKHLLLISVLSISSLAFAEKGSVAGRVFDGTKSPATPARGATVRLDIFKDGFQVAGAEAKTAGDGRYQFKDIESEKNFFYEVRVEADGARFFTSGQFKSGNQLTMPDLRIEPATGDPSGLVADDVLLFEFGKADVIRVNHSMIITNDGKELFDARKSGGRPVEISLKSGGFDLTLDENMPREDVHLVEGKNLLEIFLQVPPGGQRKVELSYSIPVQSKAVAFALPLSIRRSRASLVLKNKSASIISSQFQDEGNQEFKGNQFRVYRSGPMPAGTTLSFEVKGIPSAKDWLRLWTFIGIGLAVLAGIFFALRKPHHVTDQEAHTEEEWILKHLAALEQRHRLRQTSGVEYEQERDRLRLALFDLLSKQRKSAA